MLSRQHFGAEAVPWGLLGGGRWAKRGRAWCSAAGSSTRCAEPASAVPLALQEFDLADLMAEEEGGKDEL